VFLPVLPVDPAVPPPAEFSYAITSGQSEPLPSKVANREITGPKLKTAEPGDAIDRGLLGRIRSTGAGDRLEAYVMLPLLLGLADPDRGEFQTLGESIEPGGLTQVLRRSPELHRWS
jgi:hypothetical protein